METSLSHPDSLKKILPIIFLSALFSLTPSLAFGASLTGGNITPFQIASNGDFTRAGSTTGCACVTSGSGTSTDPYVIGPWTIMATSSGPGILINGASLTKYFTISHITIHGTQANDGIDLVNVNGLGPNAEHFDAIQAANIDGASNGILVRNSAGVTITGNSVNNSFLWGVKLDHSSQVTVTFMTIAHNGLSNPDSKEIPDSLNVFLMKSFAGGVLFQDSHDSTLSVSQLSEDAFAGFVLLRSNNNNVADVHSRYPDYFGGVLQDSSNNILNKIDMQTADFDGLLVRGGSHNDIINSDFSANGPIGGEIFRRIVPYFIAGLYLGWGTHDNRIINDHSNNGNTGPGLVVDNGKIGNPVTTPVQNVNPFNNVSGNDPESVPSTSAFDPGVSTVAGSNFYCGNSFALVSPPVLNPAC